MIPFQSRAVCLFVGGYYLTSAYGAMSLIRNFQEEQAARILSSETRNTLHQWHRRRTTQRLAPSVDDFQVHTRARALIHSHKHLFLFSLWDAHRGSLIALAHTQMCECSCFKTLHHPHPCKGFLICEFEKGFNVTSTFNRSTLNQSTELPEGGTARAGQRLHGQNTAGAPLLHRRRSLQDLRRKVQSFRPGELCTLPADRGHQPAAGPRHTPSEDQSRGPQPSPVIAVPLRI